MTTSYRNHFQRRLNLLLALPDDWRELSRDGVAAAYVGPREAGYSPNLVVYAMQGADSPDAVEGVIAVAEQSFADLKAECETEPVEVDCLPATLHTYRWHDATSGLDATQYRLFMRVGRVVFVFAFNTRTAVEETFAPVFDHFVQSVRFVPPTPLHWVDVITYVPRVTSLQA